MEVHHHPDMHNIKNHWKRYFLEFLMIFLAVTLGFFAESFREHILEKKHIHSYMQQMIENLKFDLTRCENALKYNINSSLKLDSLRYEIDNAANGEVHANRLYYRYMSSGQFSFVLFKQSTIAQLKNSGNLRLIENKELLNEILEYYDRWIVAAKIYSDHLDNCSTELKQNGDNFFNLQYFDELIKRDTIFSYVPDIKLNNYLADIQNRKPPLVLINTNPTDLKKLNNKVSNVESALHNYNSFLRLDKNLADTLIMHIQKEYNLKNE